jgi:hypothetical protein
VYAHSRALGPFCAFEKISTNHEKKARQTKWSRSKAQTRSETTLRMWVRCGRKNSAQASSGGIKAQVFFDYVSRVALRSCCACFSHFTAAYWSNIEPTVNGMLGGYEHISAIDAQGSLAFVRSLQRVEKADSRALDCGGGIGRVTKLVLSQLCRRVDILEPNQAFLDRAPQYVALPQLGELYCSGMQDFRFQHSYDLVWVQWAIGYLTGLLPLRIALRSHRLQTMIWLHSSNVRASISHLAATSASKTMSPSMASISTRTITVFVGGGSRLHRFCSCVSLRLLTRAARQLKFARF